MQRGWVRLWRKSLDSRVFADAHLFQLFVWCLLRANRKKRWVPVKTGRGETQVQVGAGQFLFGRESAAADLHVPPSTLWRRMKRLESIGCLTIKADTHFSTVNIVNWLTYQPPKRKSGQPTDRHRAAKGHASDTDEKAEKGKKGEKEENPDEARRDDHVHACLGTWEEAESHARCLANNVAKEIPPKSVGDRSLILKAGYLVAANILPENWLQDSLEAVREGKPKRNKAAYFHRCLLEKAKLYAKDFHQLLALCEEVIPPEAVAGPRRPAQAD